MASLRQRVLTLGLLLSIPITTIQAAETAETETLQVTNTLSVETSGTLTGITENKTPTGSYKAYTSTMSLTSILESSETTTTSANTTDSTDGEIMRGETTSATSSITYLTGTLQSTTSTVGNATMTSSTSSARPEATNTTPCNNYPEFCQRKYSNITEIAAHNSPFVRAGNAASNQELGVKIQLDDGVRFLQAQMQWPSNDTVPHFCHTSCDILDAGPITDWLTEVKEWVDTHPFDVVTVLLGNGNYSKAEMYAPYIESTGITKWVYTPPHLPMTLDDWPTLEDLILNGHRVIMMMDYDTQPEKYPWLMDEFSVMWETPFDPIDMSFPCTIQRPPDLAGEDARNRLFMTNHNFNVEITAFGASILVPALSIINQTNGVEGDGSLGAGAEACLRDWDRPPTFLNVDYYNYGTPVSGSVFEVAAQMNGVEYNRECCGRASNGALNMAGAFPPTLVLVAAVLVSLFIT